MIKLVLCGSYAHYQEFTEHLWSKDKDISNYKYIGRPRDILGYSSNDCTIVKLGSFRTHPECQAIAHEATMRGFDLTSRTRRRPNLVAREPARFTDGGIITVATPPVDNYIAVDPAYGRSPIDDIRSFASNAADGIAEAAETLNEDMLLAARDRIIANTYNIPEPIYVPNTEFNRHILGEWVGEE